MDKRVKIYWDSTVFLAWLKPEPERRNACKDVLDEAEEGKMVIVASAITLTEVIKLKGYPVLPREMERKIRDFFRQPYIALHQVTRKIGEDARDLIWTHPKLHPKDSIHLATALSAGVSEVHTYDDNHMTPLDGLIGAPPLRICHPHVEQAKLPFSGGEDEESTPDLGEEDDEGDDEEK